MIVPLLDYDGIIVSCRSVKVKMKNNSISVYKRNKFYMPSLISDKMQCNEYYREIMALKIISMFPRFDRDAGGVLSFKMFTCLFILYPLRCLRCCLTRWWKCNVTNKEAVLFWAPTVFTDNSEAANSQFLSSKPSLPSWAMFFSCSIKYLFCVFRFHPELAWM